MTQETKRKFYLKEFKAISHAIATYEDFNLLVKHLAEGVCRTFNIQGASIMVLDETEGQFFRVSSYGISQEYLNKGPVFVDTKYCTLDTGEVALVQDLQNDSRVQYPEAAKKEGLASLLAIPIKYRNATIGVIRLYNTEQMDINEEDINSLCVLGNQLGVVIENNGLKNFVDQIKMAIDSLPPRMFKA
ncbi:MAG: GAF domain-containing protein [Desulfobacterales bacterium]|nr:GAF domain-containing protein [Desulfobacterales bacterium]